MIELVIITLAEEITQTGAPESQGPTASPVTLDPTITESSSLNINASRWRSKQSQKPWMRQNELELELMDFDQQLKSATQCTPWPIATHWISAISQDSLPSSRLDKFDAKFKQRSPIYL